MLKLVYDALPFGPIELEYDQPWVRVGSNEDNHLVLRHASVQPYHCLLLFRGEKLLCLPPDQPVGPSIDLSEFTGPELSAGDTFAIGQLTFHLAHSSRTVALPEAQTLPAATAARAAAANEPGTDSKRYYCSRCQAFVSEEHVKLVGLVGHPKRKLCPKCSHLLAGESEPEEPPKPQPEPPKKRLRLPWRSRNGVGSA